MSEENPLLEKTRIRLTMEVVVDGRVQGKSQLSMNLGEVLQDPYETDFRDLHLVRLQCDLLANAHGRLKRKVRA